VGNLEAEVTVPVAAVCVSLGLDADALATAVRAHAAPSSARHGESSRRAGTTGTLYNRTGAEADSNSRRTMNLIGGAMLVLTATVPS
jgi:hypothetical protein